MFIKESGSTTYTQESVDCDGADSTVITNEYCYINISTLLAAPFNIFGGDKLVSQDEKVAALPFRTAATRGKF